MQPGDSMRSKGFVPPAFPGARVTLDKRRVAVLPLENLSPDPNDEYFADGLTEELISTLSNVSGLSVISRTSVKQYKKTSKKLDEIGQDLGAGTILEGSVRKAGNKVRVAVQLIEVKEDKHLWAQNYDRDLQDVFAVQSDIAERVAKALEVKLLGEERQRLEARGSRNTEAIALYMRGRTFYNEGTGASVREALDYFHRAVQQDPNFALAYVGLADCYYVLEGAYMRLEEGIAKAKENLGKALGINSELGEAHATLGWWLNNELRFEEAATEFRKAIELNPSYAYAHQKYSRLLVSVGKLDEALYEARRAEELDPAQPGTVVYVGAVSYYQREYDEAIDKYNQVLRLWPNSPDALLFMAAAYAAKGSMDEGLRVILKWRQMAADSEKLATGRAWDTAWVAVYYLLNGRKEEADGLFKEANEIDPKLPEHSPTLLAYWYAALSDLDKAFELLNKAYGARDYLLFDIKVDPFPTWEPIRSDPRYAALLEKLHLS